MHPFLFFLSLFFFSATSLTAQFSVGIQGGGNFSRMDFTNNPAYRFTEINTKTGFIGGFVMQYLGDKHAGIQAELNYSQRGWVEKDTSGIDELKIQNSMDYIEMPILTYINIGGGKLRGVFTIGAFLGFGLNRNITTENLTTGSSETVEYEFDSKKDNWFDYGLMTGAGMEYRSPIGKFTAEARLTVGLGDIDKEKFYQSEVSQFRIIAFLIRYTVQLPQKKAEIEKD